MPQLGMKLANRLSKKKDEIRSLYQKGKRKIVVDDVEFSIRRGGPGNNFLMVSPTEQDRLTPVLNFAYSERVEENRVADKVARRIALLKDVPFHLRKKVIRSGG